MPFEIVARLPCGAHERLAPRLRCKLYVHNVVTRNNAELHQASKGMFFYASACWMPARMRALFFRRIAFRHAFAAEALPLVGRTPGAA